MRGGFSRSPRKAVAYQMAVHAQMYIEEKGDSSSRTCGSEKTIITGGYTV